MSSATLNNESKARNVVEKCGYASAAVTLLPIPGVAQIAVMPIHVGMVVRIGDLYGVQIDRDTATHLILRIGATVGLSLVGSRIVQEVSKFILPGFGGALIAAPMMYASTIGIGRVAQAYFANGGISDDEIKSIYAAASTKARKTFDPKKARDSEAKAEAKQAADRSESAHDRLAKLGRMRDQGLIDAEEFEATKARILAEI